MRRDRLKSISIFFVFIFSSKRKICNQFNVDNEQIEQKKLKTAINESSSSNCVTAELERLDERRSAKFQPKKNSIQLSSMSTFLNLVGNIQIPTEENSLININNKTDAKKAKESIKEKVYKFKHLNIVQEEYKNTDFIDLLCLYLLDTRASFSEIQAFFNYSYLRLYYILSSSINNYIDSFTDKKYSNIFFASKYLYTFLSIKYTDFLDKKNEFNLEMAKKIFGPKILSIIESKSYLFIFSDEEEVLETTSFLSNEIEQLILFIASIPNLVEEFIPYFQLMTRSTFSTREEFLEIITKKVIDILELTELKYLKIYLPELYSLEVLLEQIKFASLESAIVGYILIFFMQNEIEALSIEKQNKNITCYIRSIFKVTEFNEKKLEFECLFSVLTLCLNNRDLYFSNYSYIISEYVYLIKKRDEISSIMNQIMHIFDFFKKNQFFYLKFDIVSKISCKLEKFKNDTFLFNTQSQFNNSEFNWETLKNIKNDFERLRLKHPYINDTLIEKSIDFNSLEEIKDMNLVCHFVFTLKVKHHFNFLEIKKSAVRRFRRKKIVK